MNEEYLCRVSQTYSRFDCIAARLLGEADYLYQLEQGNLEDQVKSLDNHLSTAQTT
jgi:hypothetical protein